MDEYKKMKKDKIIKLIKYIGNLFTIIALFYIVRKFLSYDLTGIRTLSWNGYLILLLSCVLYVINVYMCTFPWLQMVRIISGKKISFFSAVRVNVKANVLKYIPGNIFQYVGKNRLAIEEDVKHSEVALSTTLDVVTMVVSSLAIGIIFLREAVIDVVSQYVSVKKLSLLLLGLLVVAIVILIIVLKCKKNIIIEFIKKLKSQIGKLISCFLFYLIQNIYVSVIYIIIMYVFDKNIWSCGMISSIIGASVISWLVGFLTPGSPSGIGIREMVMMLLTNRLLPESLIVTSSITYRIITVIGDMLAFLGVLIFERVEKKAKKV